MTEWNANKIINLFNNLNENQGLRICYNWRGWIEELHIPKHEDIKLSIKVFSPDMIIGNGRNVKEGIVIRNSFDTYEIAVGWIRNVQIIEDWDTYHE